MYKKEKILAFIIAVALVISSLVSVPMMASAATVHDVASATELSTAISSAVSGDTINITADITDVGNNVLNIKSKTLTFTGNHSVTFASGSNGLTVNTGSNITIDGPTFIQGGATRALCVWEGTCTVKSGGFTGFVQNQGSTNAKLDIQGGDFTQIDGNNLLELQRDTSATTISGGNFTSVGSSAAFDVWGDASGKLKITGGTYNFDPSAYVGTGYTVNEESGIWSVVSASAGQAKIGSTPYATLVEAVNAAKTGETIEILDNITNSDTIRVEGNRNLTFTGNYTVTFKSGSTGLTCVGGTTTINGPTFAQGGATRALCVWKATVIVDNGGFDGLIDQQGGDSSSKGILTINGGTFTQDSSATNFASGKQAWLVNNSSNEYSETTINGGTFIGEGTQHFINATMGKVTITGGTFTKASGQTGIATSQNCTLSVTGGTYNFDPSAYVGTGYKVNEESGVWSVVSASASQAKIGSTPYDTLVEAVTAAKTGETIEILDNIINSDTVRVEGNRNLTFIGNYTVTFKSGSAGLTCVGGTTTINGPTFAQGEATRALCVWEATVIVDNGGFDGLIDQQGGSSSSSKGILTINGGTFTQDSSATNFASGKQAWLVNNSSSENSETTINGGTFIGEGTQHFINATMGKVTITGGTFTKASGQTGIETGQNCTLSITGGTYNFEPVGVASGYKATVSGNTWTVVLDQSNQVKIDNTEYKTIAEAMAAAQDGDTIEILEDISGVGHNVLNIKNKTLTFTGNHSVTFASGSNGLTVNTGSNITIDGPTFVQGGASRALCVWEGTCTVKSGGFTGLIEQQGGGAEKEGTLVITGGTFTQLSGNYIIENRWCAGTGSTTISGGDFVKNGSTSPFATTEKITFSITGGTYNFDPSSYVKSGYIATENYGIWSIGIVRNVSNASELATAVSQASSGDAINITADISNVGKDVLNIKNKTLTFTGDYKVTFASGSNGLTCNTGSRIAIDGPIFVQGDGDRAICVTEGICTIRDGGVIGSIQQQGGSESDGILIIEDGTFTQISGETLIDIANDKAKTDIKGGVFNKADSGDVFNVQSGATLTITGGVFDFDPRNASSGQGEIKIPVGYEVVEEDGDIWVVNPPKVDPIVRDVSNAKELAEAISAAVDGDTINIIADITDAENINTSNITAKSLIFKGNHTVTFAKNTTGLTCTTDSNIIVDGPTFVQGGASRALCVWEGTCTVKSGGFTGLMQQQGGNSKTGVLNIEGGNFTQIDGGFLLETRESSVGNIVKISGGNFTKNGDREPFKVDAATSDFSITGGIYNFDPSEYVHEDYETDNNGELWAVSVRGLYSLVVDGSVGTVAQIVTVKPNTNYGFTFKIKTEAGKVVPFVKSIASNNTESSITLSQTSNNSDGYYNFYGEFKTPSSLRVNNNLKIGFDFSADDKAVISDIVLKELNDGMEMSGINLVNNGAFENINSIPDYSTGISGWFFDGTTKNIEIIKKSFSLFRIPVKKMIFFDGKGGNLSDGGVIQTIATLQKNKTYNFSINLKYGGYDTSDNGSKMGLSFEYLSKSGKWKSLDCQFTESKTEYKQTATFSMNMNDLAAENNFRINVKAKSRYISGYLANAVLTEKESNINLINNGYFYNDLDGWNFDGYFDTTHISEIPKNYFSKVNPNTPSMIIFNESTGWYSISQSITMKPNTYYKLVSNEISTCENENKTEGENAVIMWNSSKNGGLLVIREGKLKNIETDTKSIRYYKTPEDLSGDNNITVQLLTMYMENAGYWGDLSICECDENGNVIGGNLLFNHDFSLGISGWNVGYDFPWRIVEQPKDFFKNYTKNDSTMITSNGSEANAELGQYITVQKGKKYYFSCNYIGMNSAAVTPMVKYTNKNGKEVSVELSSFHASATCYYEGEFVLPDDAKTFRNEAKVKFYFTNKNKGKAYITRIGVYEEGKYENLLTNAKFEKGFNGWIGKDNKKYSGKNYEIVPYQDVFIFHYDDAAFEDGDWAGIGDGNSEADITTGAILGTVRDGLNQALQGITVTLEGTKLSATTDEYGMFAFYDLKPGNYTVCITGPSGTLITAAKNVLVKKGMATRLGDIKYVISEDAEIIEVPEEIEEIISVGTNNNFGAVYGYLYDSEYKPWVGQIVYLGNIAFQETKEKGIFQFDNVPPGEYDLYTKLDDGTIYILKRVKVEAGKGAVYKVAVSLEKESNVLLIIIAVVSGVLLLAMAAFICIFIIKKKKKVSI